MLPMLIGAGASLLGGVLGSRSAKKAAEQQAAAQRYAANLELRSGREANALTADIYRQNQNMLSPTIGAGQTALSALMSGMGLGALQTGQRSSDIVGAQGASGYLDAEGRDYTGNVTTNAKGQIVGQDGKVLTARQDLGVTPGITQEAADAAASPFAGTFLEQFTGQDIYDDPSYQFRLSEGQRALAAKQAASGNRLGGQAFKDIANYNQQAASQEYGNAYQRFMEQKKSLYDRLTGIASPGNQAALGAAGIGSQTAGQLSSNLLGSTHGAAGNIAGAGASTAGGTVGSTNALIGGLTNAAGAYTTDAYRQQFADLYKQATSGSGSTPFYGVGNSPY